MIRDNITKLRKMFGVTQEELANIAGVTRTAVTQWEAGNSEPRMGAIERMAKHFGIYKSNLIEDRGMDYVDPVTHVARSVFNSPVIAGKRATVPLLTLGRVHAGPFSEEEAVGEAVEVPASVLERHPRAQALVVEGDCMDRFALPGMAVVIDPELTPGNGSVAVVETEDHEAVMRRWYRGGDTLLLVADSHEEYPDIVLRWESGPVRVLGVVVWVQSAGELV